MEWKRKGGVHITVDSEGVTWKVVKDRSVYSVYRGDVRLMSTTGLKKARAAAERMIARNS